MQPLHRNDDIELTIDALASEGQGVGRHEGFTVFVPFALPGERVKAHIIKPEKSYAVAKLTDIIEKSPMRVEPVCGAYGRCGGCSLMHLAYDAQLEFKRLEVENALKRIGGFTEIKVLPTIGMNKPTRYRNKAAFPFGMTEEDAQFGFFAPRSHRLVTLDDCPIQQNALIQCAKAVRKWANMNRISIYDEMTGSGELRHIVARVNKAGDVMAVIVTKGALTGKQKLIETLLADVNGIKSVIHNRNDKNTNVIFGERFELLWGTAQLKETICGLDFDISAASFLQVNPVQTEKLYRTVESLIPEGNEANIADVFCGTGTITFLATERAKKVVGIEYVADAVRDAKCNAQRNGIKNADFICGDASDELLKLVQTGFSPDAIIVDPPRKGCPPAVTEAIINSCAKRVIYVSCNPGTLARDCKRLYEGGYELESAQPVDMFPQTQHVETVVLMSKVEN